MRSRHHCPKSIAVCLAYSTWRTGVLCQVVCDPLGGAHVARLPRVRTVRIHRKKHDGCATPSSYLCLLTLPNRRPGTASAPAAKSSGKLLYVGIGAYECGLWGSAKAGWSQTLRWNAWMRTPSVRSGKDGRA
jgi:hypothetical protein